MKRLILLAVASVVLTAQLARGDVATETIQQKLKDQGFYYGTVTGKIDTDTTAAIRRYQIRNGLKISGEVDAETAKSLGVSAGTGAKSAPRPAATAAPTPRAATTPRSSATPRSDEPRDHDPMSAPPVPPARGGDRFPTVPAPGAVNPEAGYAPGPRGLQPEMTGLFDGTPFEVAPPDVQRRAVIGAQALLAHEGLYRGPIDGRYGRGLQFAVREYQTRRGINPSGALDMDTLASLGLLPGQRVRGAIRPRHREFRPRSQFAPTGERIYEPY